MRCSALLLAVLLFNASDARVDEAEDAAVKVVEKLGGKVIRDDKAADKPVRTVDLRGVPLTQANLKMLWDFKHLDTLILADKQLTGYEFHTLSKLGLLHTLSRAATKEGKRPASVADVHMLDLANSWLTDADLLELGTLQNLRQLSLRGTTISDPGLKVLKEKFADLHTLDLGGALISDEGLKHLAGLKQLQALYLDGTRVTEVGIAELQKALPTCSVFRNKQWPSCRPEPGAFSQTPTRRVLRR
jgi:hypothetical protein